MSAKVPLFPLTRSPILGDFKRALKRRSKAIKHTVSAWTLKRQIDRIDGANYESLINCWATTGPDMTLRVWEDGALWFYAREMQANRITFELGFSGSLGSESCDPLVDVLERSKILLCVRESSRAAKDEVLKLWAAFAPTDVDYGRS